MKYGHVFLGIILVLLIFSPALAQNAIPQPEQNGNLWGLDTDVDRDGLVNVQDVQHVINGALGLNEEGEQALRLRARQYVVASPHASLVSVPDPNGDGTVECPVVGAVENFPRGNARLLAKVGMRLILRFDRNTEAVWYKDACGLIATHLAVDVRPANDETAEWQPVGRDGARALRCGPSIGRADILVPAALDTAGDYVFRARIVTAAIPESELPEETAATLPEPVCGMTVTDTVFVAVKVLDGEPSQDDLDWQDIPEPALEMWGEPIPHDPEGTPPPADTSGTE